MKTITSISLLFLFGISCTSSAQIQYEDSIPAIAIARDTVRLLFVGDAMQHQSQIDAAKQKDGSYDYSSNFRNIEDVIKATDLSVVNLEVTLGGKPYRGYPAFSAPDEYAVALKDAGFDFFVTANNHSLDKRKAGLERTIKVLDSLEIVNTGTFVDSLDRASRYPLIVQRKNIKIGMLNYTYGTNGIPATAPNIVNMIDREQIKADIAAADSLGADIIVANMHWGDEYILSPNKVQKDLANFLIENGVRLVIGNHPHVVQPIDIRREGDSIKSVIVYSHGNFISGMKIVNGTGGMISYITLSKEGDEGVSIDACDYSLVWTYKPMTRGVFSDFELIPIPKEDDEERREVIKERVGAVLYNQMTTFEKNARKAIESLWTE